jgi:hypothetical protein
VYPRIALRNWSLYKSLGGIITYDVQTGDLDFYVARKSLPYTDKNIIFRRLLPLLEGTILSIEERERERKREEGKEEEIGIELEEWG